MAIQLLTERLAALLAEVDAVEVASVKPLDDCQSIIEHGVGQADELLREGGRIRLFFKAEQLRFLDSCESELTITSFFRLSR